MKGLFVILKKNPSEPFKHIKENEESLDVENPEEFEVVEGGVLLPGSQVGEDDEAIKCEPAFEVQIAAQVER